jgi:hypothetical protein
MSDTLEIYPTITFLGKKYVSGDSNGARVTEPYPSTPNYSRIKSVAVLYLYGGKKAKYMRKILEESELATAKLLLKHAQTGINTYKISDNLQGLKWEGPCYVYVILQDVGDAFLDNPAKEADPIFFRGRKLVPIPGPPRYRYYDENRSFYDGKILKSSVFGKPAFRCINYFEDESGNELKHPRSRIYAFEIRYIPSGSELTSVDPDGQNQGPPDSGDGIPMTPPSDSADG